MGEVSANLKQKFRITISKILRWLKPGINIKRWLLMMLVGLLFCAFFLSLQINAKNGVDAIQLPFSLSNTIALRVFLAIVGALFTVYGFYRFYRSLVRPFIKPGTAVLDTLSSYQKKEKGPRIVTLGGWERLGDPAAGIEAVFA